MRKKVLTLVTVLAFLAVVFNSVYAQNLKIGYINSQKIREDYSAFQAAQKKFDKKVKQWEEKAKKMEEELKQLQKEYQQQRLLLSAEKKKEKQRLIQEKRRKYQEFLQEKFGSSGQAQKANLDLTEPLIKKINEAVREVAEKEGFSMILDASGGGLIYVDDESVVDVTDKVLKELNEGK